MTHLPQCCVWRGPTTRKVHHMASIVDIEGIGAVYRRKLSAAGIKTTGRLLKDCGTKKGRQAVAAECGVSEKLVLEWVNRADLFRVRGVATQYSDLLEASGVDSVKELAQRRADNLAAKMAEVNAQKRLVRRVPTESMVASWIADAKKLPRAVSH